jgi:hypothetical protein
MRVLNAENYMVKCMRFISRFSQIISHPSCACLVQFDRFVRTPKVYESYLFYEKTLKSLDDVAEFLV